jgi:hypothetical protein
VQAERKSRAGFSTDTGWPRHGPDIAHGALERRDEMFKAFVLVLSLVAAIGYAAPSFAETKVRPMKAHPDYAHLAETCSNNNGDMYGKVGGPYGCTTTCDGDKSCTVECNKGSCTGYTPEIVAFPDSHPTPELRRLSFNN